jgi:multicomponent Na+:H+ antiporter subunit F
MLTTVQDVALVMLALATALAFLRLMRGPSLPDRVVATDLLGTLVVGLLVVSAAAADQPAFMDAAVIIALIAFVSNIAYARFMERRGL